MKLKNEIKKEAVNKVDFLTFHTFGSHDEIFLIDTFAAKDEKSPRFHDSKSFSAILSA